MHLLSDRLKLMTLALAAPCLIARPLQAQHFESRDGSFSGGFGLFAGVSLGRRTQFEWGAEAFQTNFITGKETCSREQRIGFGPVLQFSMIGLSDPGITLAAHGGRELTDYSTNAITGELGVTLRFLKNGPAFGFHNGLLIDFLFVQFVVRQQWFLGETFIGGSHRYFPTYGEPNTCVVGRPLRTGGDRVLPLSRPDIEDPLARAWAEDAEAEAASVPAFIKLARELASLNAPSSLVGRALAAAEEEVAHALECAEVASALAGYPITPQLYPLIAPESCAGDQASTLSRLAVESYLDGCLNEGVAARVAFFAAHAGRARAEATRNTGSSRWCRNIATLNARIAQEEASHAKLAWDVLAWCLERGGEATRAALVAASQTSDFDCYGVDVDDQCSSSRWETRDSLAHGRLPNATRTWLSEVVTREAQTQLIARLARRQAA